MGQWTIQDPNTNESITVEGDVPPTQQSAQEIFDQHRQAQQTPTTPGGPSPAVQAFMSGQTASNSPYNAPQGGQTAPLSSEPQYGGSWLSMPQGVTPDTYWQGVQQHAGNELTGMAQGAGMLLKNLSPPGMMLQYLQGEQNPAMNELKTLGAMALSVPGAIGQTAKDIYRDVRYPVQSFYNRPVGTTIDAATAAMMAAKGIGAVSNTLSQQAATKELSQRLMEQAATNPDEFAKMVNTMAYAGDLSGAEGETARAISDAAEKLPIEQVQETAARVGSMEGQARNLYQQIFANVPKSEIGNMDPQQVAQRLQRYGITVGNMDDLKNVSQRVIDLVHGVTADITDNLPPVPASDYNAVIDRTAGQLTTITPQDVTALKNTIQNVLPATEEAYAGGVPEDIQAQMNANLKAMVQKDAQGTLMGPRTQQALAGTGYANQAGLAQGQALQESLAQGGAMEKQLPANTMDLVKQLQQQSAQFGRHAATDLHAEQLKNLYDATWHSLENGVGDVVKDQNLIEAYKTPELMDALNSVSPTMAQDFADNVHTLREARHFIADFVQANRLADSAAENQARMVGRVSQQMGASLAAGGGRMLGLPYMGGRFGPIGILGRLAGGPIISQAINQMFTNLPGQLTSMAVGLPEQMLRAASLGNIGQLANIVGGNVMGTILPSVGRNVAFPQNQVAPISNTAYSQ